MEDVCQFPPFPACLMPDQSLKSNPFFFSLTSLFPVLWGVIRSFLYLIIFPSVAKSRLWRTGTLSLLFSLSPSFTFSPPVFLGTQVFQEFHETFTQAVQVCIPSVCQTALSRWFFPKSPRTFANKTAERELIYHSVITVVEQERAIPRNELWIHPVSHASCTSR